MNKFNKKYGEYKEKGEYHRKINKKWKYYPVYTQKIKYIEKFLESLPKNKKILDVGCGEGILIERFRKKGYDMVGLDYNYSSKQVLKGDITGMKFDDKSFDYVICLDVLEHLNFDEQEKALSEMYRILKKKGILMLSLPNLAHFASRLAFLFTGRLIRTSTIQRHKGDRPISEYIKLVKRYKFKIIKRKGIFPTYPVSSMLTYLFPDKVMPLHRMLNYFLAYPNFCFLNIIILKK